MSDVHRAFVTGDESAESIVKRHLDQITKFDGKVNAFLEVFAERAMKKAALLDKKRREGKSLGKLAGIPIAMKDNILIKGEKASCGSKILENYKATHDSTVARLIEEEDGIIVGRTNMDEFAMGSTTQHSAYKKTCNPWKLTHTPGGSSGGSAAAVAARMVPLSFGSDTGGSIRQPASFTGTVGFKPTYGRVSRHGLVAFGSSLDCIGPFANRVEDVARAMEVIGRHCHFDATSLPREHEPYLDLLKEGDLHGKTIGVPFEFDGIHRLKEKGAKVIQIDLSMMKYGIPIYYIIATAEASTNLSRFDGIRYGLRVPSKTLEEVYGHTRDEGFGSEVKQRILLGTFVLSSGYQDAFYRKAQKVRTLIIRAFKEAFTKCDAIAMPTTSSPAFEFGTVQDGITMYKQDYYTVCANLAGLPAISVPTGLQDGLPTSIQLIGPAMEDARILRFAYDIEESPLIPEGFDE